VRVVGGVEGRVHHVDIAEQAEAAAARDLAAGVVARQALGRGVGRGGDDDGLHRLFGVRVAVWALALAGNEEEGAEGEGSEGKRDWFMGLSSC
jgi:hypothetical protein